MAPVMPLRGLSFCRALDLLLSPLGRGWVRGRTRRARRIGHFAPLAALAGLSALLTTAPAAHADTPRYGLGTPATARQIEGWAIDIAPDGAGLPPGRGSVAEGRALYAQQCAACHGAQGEGGVADRLAGGIGSLASDRPVRTVGSYWPYATTLFDYIRRAMPLHAPQSLNAQQVYALSGYLLRLNGLLAEDAMVDAQTLVRLRMPNRDGFVPDPRPDTPPPRP